MNDLPPPLSPSTSPYQQAPAPPAPKKSGCGLGLGCGAGCLIVVVLCIAGVIVAAVAIKGYFGKMVDQYTATESVPVEAPQASSEEIMAAVAKFDTFQKGMEPGATPVPLDVTGEELNLILFHHPSLAPLAGKANVEIEGEQLRSRVSLDFSEIPLPEGFVADALEGKYFNGEVALSLGMMAGRPALYLEQLSVNGNPVPEVFMSQMRTTNILEEVAENPDAAELFNRIEDLKIEGGRLLIVPKAAP